MVESENEQVRRSHVDDGLDVRVWDLIPWEIGLLGLGGGVGVG